MLEGWLQQELTVLISASCLAQIYLCVPFPQEQNSEICGFCWEMYLSPGTQVESCHAVQGPNQMEEDQKQIVTAQQQLATEVEGTAMNASASIPLPDSLLTVYSCLL